VPLLRVVAFVAVVVARTAVLSPAASKPHTEGAETEAYAGAARGVASRRAITPMPISDLPTLVPRAAKRERVSLPLSFIDLKKPMGEILS
jgi:hypothetical protein